MAIKLPRRGLELQGDEVCSNENCNRPAVYANERFMDGEHFYQCQPHVEISELQGQHDWVDGEISIVKDWLSQVRNMPESAWAGAGDWKHFLVLRDEVHDDFILSIKEQHESTLQSLVAALDVARRFTQTEIDQKKFWLGQEEG